MINLCISITPSANGQFVLFITRIAIQNNSSLRLNKYGKLLNSLVNNDLFLKINYLSAKS